MKVVTLPQIAPISEDLGRCWLKLGSELELEDEELRKAFYLSAKERGIFVFCTWTEKKGSEATMGRFIDALKKIEEKKIADKLLGLRGM